MIWTATKIDDGTFCIMSLWYQHIREPRYISSPNGAMARGIFLHKFMEHFYKTDKQGNIVPKYKSAKTFANTAKVRWNFIFSRGTTQGREIKCKDKKEPWILRAEIMNISKKVYEKYSQEEAPLFIEVPFDFHFDGRHYRGKIDEIRKNMTIRDLKTGHRKPEEEKLLVDPQFTLYTLAFMSMCYADRRFAETCGVSREEVEKWCKQKFYLGVLKESGIDNGIGVADKFLIRQIADSHAERAFEIMGIPFPLENVNSKRILNYLTTFGFQAR